MKRLATRTTPLLLLLLLVGRAGWTDAAAPQPGSPAETPAKAAEQTGQEASHAAGRPFASLSPAPIAGSAAAQVAQAPAAGTTEPAQPPATPAPAAAPAAPAPPPAKIDISGFVDAYYEYNFNKPPKYDATGKRIDPQNLFRNFDFRHNELALNMAEIVINKAPSPVGYHLNLAFGKATDWIHASEPGGSETYKHILQAYLTFPAKWWGKADTIDVGKWVTPMGAEVIETKDNWNYTRSLLFAWAIPYYHAGLRYKHNFTDTTNLMFLLIQGWNDVEDNNNALSYGASYNTNLGKKLAWAANWIGGPELTNDSHDWRNTVDTTFTYTVSDKLAYMLNLDYGHQSGPTGSNGTWKGFALYMRKALSDKNAVVLRGEYFDDGTGFATGTVAQKIKEVTVTYEIKGKSGLLTRLEGRYDWSTEDVFLNSSGGKKSKQPTLLLGEVYAF